MNISGSIRRLSQVFIILFVALSGGLVYWQVVVAQQVTANIRNGRHCLPDAAPIRGRIFDRNGVLLADSKLIDPNNPPVNDAAVCGYQRHYYLKDYPSLAGLIGFYIGPNYTSTGIEKQFDAYLSGQKGFSVLGNTVNQALHRPPVGDDIYLTIDTRIQKIAEHYFDKDGPRANNPIGLPIIDNQLVFATDRGSVVISDPHTGEVLAMVSRPTFDSNRIAAGDFAYFDQLNANPEQPLVERPLQSRYVPGSTYKTVTLLAALDSGTMQMSEPFDQKQAIGPIILGGERFGPTGNNIEHVVHHFPVSLAYGYAHSDNIIFAQVGVKTGSQTWLDYNRRFYVERDIPFDLPVARSHVLPNGQQTLSDAQLGENAFGQGVDFITPMQMSLFDNGIANNGNLMRPYVVMKIQTPAANNTTTPASVGDTTVIFSNSPQSLGNPISDQTANQVRYGMYGVVRCGSGAVVEKLTNSPWAIIAKTGTGEVGGAAHPQAWLITQAPYHSPQLTIVGMRENGGEGGYLDGPMIADMYHDIFTQVMKAQLPPPIDPFNPYCYDQGFVN
ncbi:MAG: penicillin-binding protein 2 [Chloroflexota bacterium]|nr:penicillin-binding protein 2 [Chloroflexota bacterium]